MLVLRYVVIMMIAAHLMYGRKNKNMPPSTAAAPIKAYVPESAKVPSAWSKRCKMWPKSLPNAAPLSSDGTKRPLGTAIPYTIVARLRREWNKC